VVKPSATLSKAAAPVAPKERKLSAIVLKLVLDYFKDLLNAVRSNLPILTLAAAFNAFYKSRALATPCFNSVDSNLSGDKDAIF